MNELQNYLHSSNIDFAALSETWLAKGQFLSLQNYTLYRRDRENGEHGGVAIAVKNKIKHALLPAINTTIIEAVVISIPTASNRSITLISCYFPGGSSPQKLDLFKKDIKILTSITKASYFLIGDFNSKHRL